MCGSMADIQSAAAEIRRGKKRKKKKKEQTTAWKYNGLPYYLLFVTFLLRIICSDRERRVQSSQDNRRLGIDALGTWRLPR